MIIIEQVANGFLLQTAGETTAFTGEDALPELLAAITEEFKPRP